MKVALVFGSKGKIVKPRLQEVKDNLDIECYDTVASMIDTTYKRNIKYDRVLILSTQITSQAILSDLYNFWSNIGKDTEIVMLGMKNTDDALAKKFVDTFVTPVATAMLVESTTVALIAQSVLQPVQELNKNFGVTGSMKVSSSDGVVIPEIERLNQEKKAKEEAERKRKEEQRKKEEATNKKKGFFGGLFGGNKKNNKKESKQEQQQVTEQNVVSEDYYNKTSEFESETPSFMNDDVETSDTNNYDTNNSDVETSDEYNSNSDNFNDEETASFMNDYEGTDESEIDYQSSALDSYEDKKEFEDVKEDEDDFAPEVEDEDFGDDTYTESYTENTNSEPIQTVDDEDFSNINIGQAEEEYKKANETPKVVTKTVVKEVIRNVATNTQLVDKIYNGTNSQIIIVTGDRGTGVTTAALSLAKVFSEKVNVLYMDCDVDTHGLLSYINYETFRNYGETHMQGVKLCKSVRNFQNSCAISYDTNFDILSTDYTCDTTDEELEEAAGVVASIADEYGVVIVDCPVSKLHCIGDLLIQGVTVVTVEASKRGFMNMLCTLENSALLPKYKRGIAGKGTMFITKAHKNTDIKKLVNYVKAIVVMDEVDWLNMKKVNFDGKLTDIMINSILER